MDSEKILNLLEAYAQTDIAGTFTTGKPDELSSDAEKRRDAAIEHCSREEARFELTMQILEEKSKALEELREKFDENSLTRAAELEETKSQLEQQLKEKKRTAPQQNYHEEKLQNVERLRRKLAERKERLATFH